MSFMDNVDRLELSLIRVKEVSSKTASPSGPFTLSFSSPFSSIIREAEPGEREIFRYVGPKSTPQQTHAPPSSSHQALFELNPPKPSTPLRPSTTARGVVTDPEILLGAALKLVDGYRPMPRKRKLIVSLFEKYEGLKDSIMALEEAVETFDASQQTQSAAAFDDGWGDEPAPPPPPPSVEPGPSIQERTRKAEAESKDLERKVAAAKKAKLAREKAAAEAAAPPRAPSPPPRVATPPPTPPPAAINPLIQTPTITRFLNSSRSRTPSREYDQPQLNEEEEEQDEVLPEEDDEEEEEGLAGEEDDATVMLAPPVVIPASVSEPAAPVPLILPPKIVPKPAGEVEMTKEVVSILENLWHTFPEILRQSPGAPLEAFLSPAETLFVPILLPLLPFPSSLPSLTSPSLSPSLSTPPLPIPSQHPPPNPLPPPPPPPPSSSSLSLASTSTPQHPPTTQGVLLAHLFLLLLASKETSYTLTMGQVKRGVVERVKEGGLRRNAGGVGAGVEVEEGGVTKVVYWGVGKRGLVIKRGGGEAKVGFA